MSLEVKLTLKDAVFVVDNLGEGSETVCSAGGVRDNLQAGVVLLVVHSHHKHGRVSRGGRDDNLNRVVSLKDFSMFENK